MTAEGLLAVFMSDRANLQRFLIARGASPAESEDVLQELYLKLGNTQTGPISEPRAYLYGMAHNLLNDWKRSAARQGGRESAWASSRMDGDGQTLAAPSIEDVLIQRERLKEVENALAALPERTSLILRQYRVDGVSQKTIAADLGITLSAVEKHLQRAYRAVIEVRQRLDADSGGQRRLGAKGDEQS
ncbi:MAG: polymerase sigma factor [Sphingomonadales bacterium]|nr:polymerase sigma factor [Sphingomonadales bacterium]